MEHQAESYVNDAMMYAVITNVNIHSSQLFVNRIYPQHDSNYMIGLVLGLYRAQGVNWQPRSIGREVRQGCSLSPYAIWRGLAKISWRDFIKPTKKCCNWCERSKGEYHKRSSIKWIGHQLRRNSLIRRVLEGRIEEKKLKKRQKIRQE